jgi:RNA polymerase sigma factor (sigma-70 family)
MPTPDRLAVWLNEYRKPLVAYAVTRFDLDDGEARDVVQEVIIGAHRQIDAIPLENEWAYLKTAVHHRSANRIRSRDRQAPHVAIDEARDEDLVQEPLDDTLARRETTTIVRARIRAAIERMTQAERECYLLRQRGLSYDAIAEELDIPMSKVKNRLHAAAKRLREEVGTVPKGIDWRELAQEDDE